jgi:queuine tRNA-ribosyltransferase
VSLNVKLLHSHPNHPARVTQVTTAHGTFVTPTFMPVGTYAAVNCLTPPELIQTGSQIILGGNTYHMLCAPGMDILQAAGGMHPYMAWSGPMLTDSGGFQVFSLARNSQLCQIDEQGAHFKHPSTGRQIHLTPQTSIAAQKIIGADIIMAFDQCTPDSVDKTLVAAAMTRTHRWLGESIAYHRQQPESAYGYRQALFGIIQGSFFEDLRRESAEAVVQMAPDGIAIGGETIGYDMAKTRTILNWIMPLLPEHKLRYTMGVGLTPQNLLDVIALGIDIFDCVAPTRNARHGSLYSGDFVIEQGWPVFRSEYANGQLTIKNSRFVDDDNPIMAQCDCYTCQHYSRAFLHYLYKQKALSFFTLACLHNVRVMQLACEHARTQIQEISRGQ